MTGRWPSRDPIEEKAGINLFAFVANDGIKKWDILGQTNNCSNCDGTVDDSCCLEKCEEGCGGNVYCITACFDKCTKGEVPTGTETLATPTPLINQPGYWEAFKKIMDGIIGGLS